ncbi:hypothetical protein LMG27952_01428 [Paraburkholderia hiiakae]|uniref:Uncharacterized protein n=1 Tax=Paraburkholderia hiiakae TaxID=1081782 RepID=A0ABN7HMM0_9BURK|nr:hypothetical protein LMG27952_01428 [Paraburkholderia hiiakae]
MLAQHFHRHGALAGDHVGIVEGMHEGQAALFLQAHGVGVGVAVRLTGLHDLDGRAAVRAHRIDLHLRRGDRHADHRFHAQFRGRKRHTLRVIARGGGDHAALQLRGREVRHLVVGAAQLEGEHGLVVLALEEHGVAQARREVRGTLEFGLAGGVVDAGGEDCLQVIVVGGHARTRRARV